MKSKSLFSTLVFILVFGLGIAAVYTFWGTANIIKSEITGG